ncbi:MAG: HIT family protein [Lentisphaeria bacterium]|nr:HIT family protein [Lentisphaeria bacterium]
MLCQICEYLDDPKNQGLRLWENDNLVLFLHLAAINPGHCLLVPKKHAVSINSIPNNVQAELLSLAPQLAQAVSRAVDADGYNIYIANGPVAGQSIEHAAVHLIPRHIDDGFSFALRNNENTIDIEDFKEKLLKRL